MKESTVKNYDELPLFLNAENLRDMYLSKRTAISSSERYLPLE